MEFKKLWEKENSNKDFQKIIEKFTVGKDRDFDVILAKFDVLGNKAHVEMLNKIGFISDEENLAIQKELDEMLILAQDHNLKIDDDVEDIHSQIEYNLTQKLGDAGKKIHTGRSRNDQVAVDIKLYLRSEIEQIAFLIKTLFDTFIKLADHNKNILMPGYTHYQIAMPSSFGLWFSAFAESLSEDLELLSVAYASAHKNPLGSGAGYGSSFPLDRDFTTEKLGFQGMNINSIYAQMTRGKSEKTLAFAMASIAATLGKMANDICLYSNQNYGFFSFPSELTTGSSIMPHKKNPDVFELIRGKSSRIQAIPNELILLTNNLSTGYNREYQLTKEILFPAIEELKSCLELFDFMIQHIQLNEHILDDKKYDYLFSVEKINDLILSGKGFRDAYREVGNSIENGTYQYKHKDLNHSHKGSIGNLALDEIQTIFDVNYRRIMK